MEHYLHLNIPPHKVLIGESAENFYQLGLNDRDDHHFLLQQSLGILATPWPNINKPLQSIINQISLPILEMNGEFKRLTTAYADGLGADVKAVAMGMLIPELMCFMDKWIPGLPQGIFGCSSIFFWCDKRETLAHARVLDFPFHGTFDRFERSMLAHLDGGAKIFSFGSAGLFYPSVTSMNEHGLTLALHQKFSNFFHLKGRPIFDLINELLNQCQNIEDCIRFLKVNPSLTTWGLYIGHKSGEILMADLAGPNLTYDIVHINQKKPIYFCNERKNCELQSLEQIPFGMNQFNEMRKMAFAKKLKQFKKKNKKITSEKMLANLGYADPQNEVKGPEWLADPMTPSTLQSSVLIPETEEALFLPGPAPKFFNGEALNYSNIFHPKVKIETIKIKGEINDQNYQKGLFHYMRSQVAFDEKNSHQCYHHIQLAIEYFEGNPYQKLAKFYFNVYKYIYETHKKSLAKVLVQFKTLEGHLPSYVNDHCLLFISRLELLISGSTAIGIDEIHHVSLQRVFQFEQSIPKRILHFTTREFMNPRLELLDIIYPHVKA